MESSRAVGEAWRAGVNLAGAHALRQAQWQHHCAVWLMRPGPQALDQALRALRDCVLGLLAWPLDLLRIQHAHLARIGLVPLSLLESQRFERQLGQIEQSMLGPWRARRDATG
jgi:hypothetical protein